MPILHKHPIEPISQDVFSKIDYDVTGAAFTAQNELGRLFDETHYAQFLENYLRKRDFQVEHEYKVSLQFQDFKKDYFIDLLVNNSVPYELKTVEKLNREHDAQTLNYLYLCNVRHGEILNFRKPSLERRFISTTLLREDRRKFTIEERGWCECCNPKIKDVVNGLLNEWGTHLSLKVYRRAFIHFCCSQRLSNEPLKIKRKSGYSGDITLNRIDEDRFLYLTSNNKHLKDYEKHLHKILELTDQHTAQWVHFDRNHVHLRSIHSPPK